MDIPEPVRQSEPEPAQEPVLHENDAASDDKSATHAAQSGDHLQGTIDKWKPGKFNPTNYYYGFIKCKGFERDIYFNRDMFNWDSFRGYIPEVGTEVEFDLFTEDDGKQSAKNIKLKKYPEKINLSHLFPGNYLHQWAFGSLKDGVRRSGEEFKGCVPILAEMALKETWNFGSSDNTKFEILENYYRYTFFRLWREKKVATSREGKFSTFNTGLVNEVYEPIYAVYQKNYRARPPWRFAHFAIPSVEKEGKDLHRHFAGKLPDSTQYFNSADDIYLRPNWPIEFDYLHIIKGGIEEARLPQEFLKSYWPTGVEYFEYHQIQNKYEKKEKLKILAQAVLNDQQRYNDMKGRISNSLELARKRARWNHKTALPSFYPKFYRMDLLLPLALVRDDHVDVALVVEDPTPESERRRGTDDDGTYIGNTILTLDMAYRNARLVCRPDSDWLTTDLVAGESDDDEEVMGEDDDA